jgi:hypothetical protein
MQNYLAFAACFAGLDAAPLDVNGKYVVQLKEGRRSHDQSDQFSARYDILAGYRDDLLSGVYY